MIGLLFVVAAVGVVVPVVPGSLVAEAAVVIWVIEEASTGHAVLAYAIGAMCTAVLIVAAVIKYVLPSRRLKQADVASSSMVVAGLLGIVGFFVVPVVGLVLGFVFGIFLAERRRVGSSPKAWAATKAALRASGLAILIEMAGVLVAGGIWFAGALAG